VEAADLDIDASSCVVEELCLDFRLVDVLLVELIRRSAAFNLLLNC
jgi:hypothetical protein